MLFAPEVVEAVHLVKIAGLFSVIAMLAFWRQVIRILFALFVTLAIAGLFVGIAVVLFG